MAHKIPDIYAFIDLDSIGSVTKSRWTGRFKIRCILTHGDRLAISRINAELLPRVAAEASEDDKLRSQIISELSVRVVDGPEWWDATKGGILLVDDEPIFDLIVKVHEAQTEWKKKLEEVANQGDVNANVPGIPKP